MLAGGWDPHPLTIGPQGCLGAGQLVGRVVSGQQPRRARIGLTGQAPGTPWAPGTRRGAESWWQRARRLLVRRLSARCLTRTWGLSPQRSTPPRSGSLFGQSTPCAHKVPAAVYLGGGYPAWCSTKSVGVPSVSRVGAGVTGGKSNGFPAAEPSFTQLRLFLQPEMLMDDAVQYS